MNQLSLPGASLVAPNRRGIVTRVQPNVLRSPIFRSHGSFSERLQAGVVGNRTHGDAKPRIDPRLDAFERVELGGQRDRAVRRLCVAGRVVDGPQRMLEVYPQRADALV